MKRDRLNSESDVEKAYEFEKCRGRSRLPSEEKPYRDHKLCPVGGRGTLINNQGIEVEIETHVSPKQPTRQFSKSRTPGVGDEQEMIDTQPEQHLRNGKISPNLASIGHGFVTSSNTKQIPSLQNLMNGGSQGSGQSESDSELETTIPQPLDGGMINNHLRVARSGLPVSTNPDQKSVLQVSRTPYSEEPKHMRLPVMRNQEQPSTRRFGSSLEELPPDDMIFSTFENKHKHNETTIQGPMEGSGDTSRLQRLAGEDKAVAHQGNQGMVLIEPTTMEASDDAILDHQQRSQTVIAMPLSPESTDLSLIMDAKSKRKAGESSRDLTNVTKRRKRLKFSTKFGFSQDAPVSGEDPKIRAQKQRRDFLAGLKNDNLQSRDPTNTDFRHEGHESDAITSSDDLRNGRFDSATRSIKDDNLDSDIDTDATASDTQSSERSNVNRRASHRREDNDIDTRSLISELLEAAATPDMPQSTKLSTPNPPCPARLSYFDLFKQAYPAYTGSETHFLAMCGKLKSLEIQHRVEHRSLWDDFIVRHQTEYRQYLLQCTEQAEDPIPYERFYREKIDMPLYTKAIITPSNLGDLIMPREPLEQGNVQEHRSLQYQPAMTNGSIPQSIAESRQRSVSSTPSSYRVRNPQLISRTQSPRPAETMERQHRQIKAASPSHITRSPNQQVTIISRSPSQPAENTNHKITTSNIVELPSSPSPPPSTKSTPLTTNPPRPLPWKKPAPAPSKLPSSTSNQPHSSPGPSKLSPFRAFAKPPVPSTTPKPAYSEPAIPSHLGKTSPAPASQPTSTRSNHAQSVVPPPATSSAPKESAGTSTANAKEWYHDPSTPFKDFMRADLAIRAGNGNAWAMEKAKGMEMGKGKERQREARREVKLNVMWWML